MALYLVTNPNLSSLVFSNSIQNQCFPCFQDKKIIQTRGYLGASTIFWVEACKGAWCLQRTNYFSRSWRCWVPCVQYGRCFQASEDLLTYRRAQRDLPSTARALLTIGSLTTESQQGFPESDFGTWRRKMGGFLSLNLTAPIPLLL